LTISPEPELSRERIDFFGNRVAYFALPAAMSKILDYQRPLLHELASRLDSSLP